MIDAFLLMVYLGTGEFRKLESDNMYFYSVTEYGSLSRVDPKDRVTAYCIPRQVNPKVTKVY